MFKILCLLACLAALTGCKSTPASDTFVSLPPAAYGRAMLADDGRAAYDAILLAAQTQTTQSDLSPPVSRAAFDAALQAVYADCPDLDWLHVSPSGTPVFSFAAGPMDPALLQQRDAEIREATAPLLKSLPEAPIRRLEALHDRLLAHLTYRRGTPNPEDGTLHGALVNGIAVCNGYSRAFQYLCQQAGFPCYFIEGVSVRGIPHSWNMVRLESDWLYVDATWNEAPHARPYHDYFLVTLDEMAREHFPSAAVPPLPGGEPPGYYQRLGYCADASSPTLRRDLAEAFFRQLRDFPPGAPGPVFLEVKLLGEPYLAGRTQFQRELYPLLAQMAQKAGDENLSMTIETTGAVEYHFNDATRVLTLYPVARNR